MKSLSRNTFAALAVCGLLAGCGAGDGSPAAASSAVSTPPSGELTPTDLAYVELAIPQNESALAAAELTLKRPGSAPALLALAQRIDSRYRDELTRLNGVLSAAGVVNDDQHEGHDMPGMITELELRALDQAQGGAFDEGMTAALRTQVQEALTVARSELSAGTAKPVLELGADIERNRTELLSLLGAP
ncbi:DUF305 domain-containing protein [Umezawaea sp. Da 62-37]|uniref:DUF305 domain-containing protein n=1 Tax=Umezawaea sp. Da 62-37 TaxID=3075927 RepID=UPI0028F7312B|nr:DUF305 domain-containing protein [Umezawaea sp. Da 62-37]WNV82130.1 DUF305 domain-containing protein [Umezawaea sp. Da 62-37]